MHLLNFNRIRIVAGCWYWLVRQGGLRYKLVSTAGDFFCLLGLERVFRSIYIVNIMTLLIGRYLCYTKFSIKILIHFWFTLILNVS